MTGSISNFSQLKNGSTYVGEAASYKKNNNSFSNEMAKKSFSVQIIFSLWSFEISEGILKNYKSIIGLDSFSNQRFLYLALFG